MRWSTLAKGRGWAVDPGTETPWSRLIGKRYRKLNEEAQKEAAEPETVDTAPHATNHNGDPRVSV